MVRDLVRIQDSIAGSGGGKDSAGERVVGGDEVGGRDGEIAKVDGRDYVDRASEIHGPDKSESMMRFTSGSRGVSMARRGKRKMRESWWW